MDNRPVNDTLSKLIPWIFLIVLLAGLLQPSELRAQDAESDQPYIVFLVGEREYQTEKTLPAFARTELRPQGIRYTFIFADDDDRNRFPGISAVEEADLLFLSVRRRTPPKEQLDLVRKYLDDGNSLIAIRTSSHAFSLRLNSDDYPDGHAEWSEFDQEVLGADYQGHYGNEGGTEVIIPDAAQNHPILDGVRSFRSGGTLYRSRDLAPSTTLLLKGRALAEGKQVTEPIAWTNSYQGGRIFYTSLGHPADFKKDAFRQLLVNAVFWALAH